MATDHGSANFVGVDISDIFPTAIFPRNCNFYQENFLDGVSQPDGTFDVVFQRNVSCGLTFELWQKAMAEAFRVLKPGGYYECVEAEYQLHNCGPFTHEYFEHLLMIMAYGSVDPLLVRALDKLMVAAGFTDVKVTEYMVPIGQWGGKIGVMWQHNVLTGMATVKNQLRKTAGMTEQQVAAASVRLEKELSEGRTHSIVHVVCGRKPE
ncbi:hypothetical protein BGZ70_005874 [Mortierella alpina]|uniref:Methyltransferase type 11 domain-containing protein n=1 Tax=Mortierella alpina TaxID=64518 RepID=A0A9P6JBW6_MORAP|nr:hypothetical protein BGZ70_005874 [Mortierella alpina]